MTIAALIVAVIAGAGAIVAHRQNRRERRWREDRDRYEAYGERLAARNGHPDGDVVAVTPIQRDPRP